MMASKKSEAGTQRPKQKPPKQIGMMQFVLVGVGIIVLIVVAMLLFGGGGKQVAKPRSRMASAEGDSTGRQRTAAARSVRRASSARDDKKAQRLEERQRKQEAKASGSRTTRSSSGGYTSGSARTSSSPNQLRAILTDNAGSRMALVGERRLKAGDDVEGRRIVEVTAEGVKVEYRQNTYTVRVGQKIY
jgi:sRNA-binding protein